ncbi:hypothetical protein EON66_04855 [archaeon]|nr:MAG: hypothetical protein EON66_04855 [archaeon]
MVASQHHLRAAPAIGTWHSATSRSHACAVSKFHAGRARTRARVRALAVSRLQVSADHIDLTLKKKVIDASFVRQLLALFDSEDARERDYLKVRLQCAPARLSSSGHDYSARVRSPCTRAPFATLSCACGADDIA